MNDKKPALAAWNLVTRPKSEGGLGVIKIQVQNNALLLKNHHKFFNRMDLPWVNLLWDNYYANGAVPDNKKKCSFWWRSILKLLTEYKGLASVQIQDGKSVQLWSDLWNGNIRSLSAPQLFSFTNDQAITVKSAWNLPELHQLFQLPLSEQAYQQFLILSEELAEFNLNNSPDLWTYIWGNQSFSTRKSYKVLIGHSPTHPSFMWTWKSKCQPKHKVFFWLLLQGCINTRGRLRERNMDLDSYTCENCILQ